MAYTNIDLPTDYFNTVLYTGTGSSNARTGVGFKPDWVWIKGRSGATDHGLYDAVRGVQKQLESNNTDAETTEATGLTAFGTDGFTVGALAQLNTSSATYVAWNWLGANTTVSNTSGTITSTVSANTTSGFSIVSYTGTGATATVGHGLGVTPKMLIVKKRDTSGTDWTVWGSVLGGTVGSEKITLEGTGAKTTGLNSSWFNNTAPTSTLFTIGTQSDLNSSGATYIGYCFAEVKGYSKFGGYTGNGNADGTFVYTGFKPAYVMIKLSSNSGDPWFIFDNKRTTYNVMSTFLFASSSAAEETNTNRNIDFLSNGFKLRNSDTSLNYSGYTYIYMAFAENPFVSSTGIPTTAR
jgi:hypothetical protein